MVKIVDRLIMEFKNNFFNEKKILLVGKQDNKEKEILLYYVRNYRGNRLSKKYAITKKEAFNLKSKACNIIQY